MAVHPYADAVTNRDLYLEVSELLGRHHKSERSLAEFLRALRAAWEPHYAAAGLTPDQLLHAVEQGFSGAVPDPDPSWRLEDLSGVDEEGMDADAVDRLVKSQVLDMEDAEASGAAADEYRDFGKPVGRAAGVLRATDDLYYNWSPRAFVECGVVGAFGGWEPGDDTGRVLVPGDVAVLTDDGLVSMPADQVESPVVELALLTWADLARFLWCGQSYE